jgi:RNA polymerase sigma-70 factor (ECF subfamily)
LDEQDTQLWDLDAIAKAESLLQQAFVCKKIGRFQLEAAIQSAHSARVFQKINNWEQIISLYDGLIQIVPTVGAFVSRAAAIAECRGAEPALQNLNQLDQQIVAAYQPFWVLKAVLLKKINKLSEAHHCYEVAIGLTEAESVKSFLRDQKNRKD